MPAEFFYKFHGSGRTFFHLFQAGRLVRRGDYDEQEEFEYNMKRVSSKNVIETVGWVVDSAPFESMTQTTQALAKSLGTLNVLLPRWGFTWLVTLLIIEIFNWDNGHCLRIHRRLCIDVHMCRLSALIIILLLGPGATHVHPLRPTFPSQRLYAPPFQSP